MDREASTDVKRHRPDSRLVYHPSLSTAIPSSPSQSPLPPIQHCPPPDSKPQSPFTARPPPSSLSAQPAAEPYHSSAASPSPSLTLPPPPGRSVTTPLNSTPPVGPSESAAGNSYSPVSGSQAYPDARPEHGSVIRSPRTPLLDAAVSRPSTSIGPPDYSPSRRRAPPPSADWPPAAAAPVSTMDGSAVGAAAMTTPRPPQQLPYGQPPMEPGVNGVPVHMAYSMQPPEQHYATAAVPAQGYVPQYAPQSPYGAPMAYQGNRGLPMSGPQHRRSVRAQQACNNCRARKQKCDEQKPCSWCRGENLNCEYRDIPPPKSDKHAAHLLKKIDFILDNQKMTMSKLDQLLGGGSAPSSPATARTPSTAEPFAKPRVATLDESPPLEAGVDKAPGDHSTGAHHLMHQWGQIKAWYTQAGIYDESYVINLEEEQGVLRLLSYGTSGPGGTFTGVNPRSPPSADRGVSHPSPPADEVYLNSYGQRDYIKPYNLGGLNADKSLRIDSATVKKLFDAYMKNIWVMYPMFAYTRIKAQAENFMIRYSPNDPLDHTHARSQAFSGVKRKADFMDEVPEPHAKEPGYCGPPRRPIDHSPDNAIMLLILALGKLCDHDDFIALPEYEGDPAGAYGHDSPPSIVKGSPTQSTSSYSNVASPAPRPLGNPPMNVDLIPGLAYYTEAIHIISELGGNRSLAFAHAYILAGLYMGILGRVLQSWHWINQATQLIANFQRKYYKDIMRRPRMPDADEKIFENEENNPDFRELLVLAFYTCHQLEGDIRAELDTLPASGLIIEDHEGRCVKWPGPLPGVPHHSAGLSLPLFNDNIPDWMLVSYHLTAQLILRNMLNRTHRMLYGELEKEGTAETTAAELWFGLQSWRNRMHPRLQWRDNEPLPSDILSARTRAKYYGAAYIINRPFLYKALYPQEGGPQIGPFDYEEINKIELETDLHNERAWGKDELGVRCRLCILSALKSTVAFDGLFHSYRGPLTRRPKLSNIHGTAAAQFSNMLVVSNAYLNPLIRRLIPEDEFLHSLERTILLLERLSPMSPVFKKNMEVLRHAKRDVVNAYRETHGGKLPPPFYDQQQQYLREYEQHNHRREYGQAQSPGRSHSYSHQPHHSQSYSATQAQSPRPHQQPPPLSSEPPPPQQQPVSSQQQWPGRSYSVSYSPSGGPATPGTPQFSGSSSSSSAAPPAAASATAGAGNGGGERPERGDRASGGQLGAPSSFSAPQR